MADRFTRLLGTMRSFLHIGGPSGPRVARNGDALEGRLSDNSDFAVMRGAMPGDANDLATKQYVDTIAQGVIVGPLSKRPDPGSTNWGMSYFATDTGLRAIDRMSTNDVGGRWDKTAPILNLRTFYSDPTYGSTWDQALLDAQEAAREYGQTDIYVPPGDYLFAATPQIDVSMHLFAAGPGCLFASALFRQQTAGNAGIVFNSVGTSKVNGRADFSRIEAIGIVCDTLPVGPPAWASGVQRTIGDIIRPTVHNRFAYRCIRAGASGSVEPTWLYDNENPSSIQIPDGDAMWECQWAHGIVARCTVQITRCLVSGFEGNGIDLLGNSLGAVYSNVNEYGVDQRTRVQECNGDGIAVFGGDANAGVVDGIDIDLGNPLTGFRAGMNGASDNPQINTSWFGWSIAFCLGHAYFQDNASDPSSVIVGGYCEQGDGTPTGGGNGPIRCLSPNTMIIGGFAFAAGVTSDSECFLQNGDRVSSLEVNNSIGTITFGTNGSLGTFQAAGETGNYRWDYQTTKWYSLSFGGSDLHRMIQLSGDQSSFGPGQMMFPNSYWVGPPDSPVAQVIARGEFHAQPATPTLPLAPDNAGYYFRQNRYTENSQGAAWGLVLYDAIVRLEWNDTTGTCTISSFGGGAGTVTLPPGKACWVQNTGTDILYASPVFDPHTGV